MSTKIGHVPYVCVSICLESEHKDTCTFVEWHTHKNVPPQLVGTRCIMHPSSSDLAIYMKKVS
jgi:hypothetical protein